MNYKLKKIFTNTRVIIVLVFVLLAIVAIRPSFSNDGVAIRAVAKNSSAELAGLENPKPGVNPMSREVIKYINDQKIHDLADFENIMSQIKIDDVLLIETNKDFYRINVLPLNNESNEIQEIGLNVYDAPTNNIRKGLDIQGGTRVLLAPERNLDANEMELVIESMRQRLNIYGLSDIVIREAGDLPPPLGEGNQYIIVEVAGINEEEVKELLSQQGKFEAKIGDEIAFIGGRDITYVCRSPDCSGIDPSVGCNLIDDQNEVCRFRFSIVITHNAAENMANLTRPLAIVTTDENGERVPDNQQYLNKTLDFYLDNVLVDSLNIGKDLKGSVVTDIQISGSGSGVGRTNAVLDSLQSMKSMQTVLITGSLPVEINIVKVDTISPVLGQKFMKNALLVGIVALLSVALVIFLRYLTLKVVIPITIIMISEVIILLGVAALIRQNIDLAAIAGILVSVGTGVDDQIVIADETLDPEKKEFTSWKNRMKNAFFIIFAAYSVTVVAMIPLLSAGAGLLKGFAVTTIIGVTAGVLITRPAFAKILEILLNKD
jgi:preprotein translocase subunit SecD